jgi:hypothetical protein
VKNGSTALGQSPITSHRSPLVCAKCGVAVKVGKKFCAQCVEARWGVVVQREIREPSLSDGWNSLGEGCWRRRPQQTKAA